MAVNSEKLLLLRNLTDLNLIYLNNVYQFEPVREDQIFPPFIENERYRIIKEIICDLKKGQPSWDLGEYSSAMGFRFICCPRFENQRFSGAVVLGPVFLDTFDYASLDISSSSEDSQAVISFLENIHAYSLEKYDSVKVILFNVVNNSMEHPHTQSLGTGEKQGDTETLHSLDRLEYSSLTSYLKEQSETEAVFLNCVERGNVEKLEELFNRPRSSSSYILNKRAGIDSLRNRKDLALVANSLALRAARQGGLPPVLGFHISNNFAVLIERTSRSSEVDFLRTRIMREYCAVVREYSNRSRSPLIKKTIDYVLMNLSNPIDLKKISSEVHANPSYLSRKFKEETSMGLMDFIKEERIKLAGKLMDRNTHSFSEIADSAGFKNYSHFSQVFRKSTGYTPSQWCKRKK